MAVTTSAGMAVHRSSRPLWPCVWAGSDVVVLRAAEAERREQQQSLDEHEHDDRDDEHGQVQVRRLRPCSVTMWPGSMPGQRTVARGMVVLRVAQAARMSGRGSRARCSDERRMACASRLDDAQGLPRVVQALGEWLPMIRRDVPQRGLAEASPRASRRWSWPSCRALRWPRTGWPHGPPDAGDAADRLVLRYRGLAARPARRLGLPGAGALGRSGASGQPRAAQAGVVLAGRPRRAAGGHAVGHRRLRHDAVHGPHGPAPAADDDRGTAAAAGGPGDAAAARCVTRGASGAGSCRCSTRGWCGSSRNPSSRGPSSRWSCGRATSRGLFDAALEDPLHPCAGARAVPRVGAALLVAGRGRGPRAAPAVAPDAHRVPDRGHALQLVPGPCHLLGDERAVYALRDPGPRLGPERPSRTSNGPAASCGSWATSCSSSPWSSRWAHGCVRRTPKAVASTPSSTDSSALPATRKADRGRSVGFALARRAVRAAERAAAQGLPSAWVFGKGAPLRAWFGALKLSRSGRSVTC